MNMIERLEELLMASGDSWVSSSEISRLIGTPCASTRISDLRQKFEREGSAYEIEAMITIGEDGVRYGSYRIKFAEDDAQLSLGVGA